MNERVDEILALKISLSNNDPVFKEMLSKIVLENGKFSEENLSNAISYYRLKASDIIKEIFPSS